VILLDAAIDPQDRLFRYIRDDPSLAGVRDVIEHLWRRYEPYADPNFAKNIANKLRDRFWEMYLACALMDQGHRLERKHSAKGPDICILNGNSRVWVEAVAPGPGETRDAVPFPRLGGDYVRTERILLRLRSAIEEKWRKHAEWLKKGTVLDSEPYLIAINGGYIPGADTWSPSGSKVPHIVQAVSRLGAPYVRVDRETGEVLDRGYCDRPAVIKESGEPISTGIFLEPGYEGISAILFSAARVLDLPLPGSDFIFVHHPAPRCTMASGWLTVGYEFWYEAGAWFARRAQA
jgi:hypothetical protein